MPLLGQLADIEVVSAKAQGLLDRGPLPFGTGAGQVQMQSVEPDLLSARRHEAQPDLPVVPRKQHAVALVHNLPSEQLSPEPGHRCRLPSVEGNCHETCGHLLHARRDSARGHRVSCGQWTAPWRLRTDPP